MSLRRWDEQVVPRATDVLLRGHAIGELRAEVCAELGGRVVEIGFGSGLNVRWYGDAVTSVTAIEPSDVGWSLSERRRTVARVPVQRAGLDGQALDLPDDSHDAALITFSLCTIPNPVRALNEVRRVVRPGGRLHFLEHGLSPDVSVQRWQRRLEPIQRRIGGGCHLTRNPAELLPETGWQIETMTQGYLDGASLARPLLPLYRGVAAIAG